MAFFIPVYRKLKYSESVVIPRSLPKYGDLVVKEGDTVVPFTKIGRAKVSKENMKLDDSISFVKGVVDGSLVYTGEKIGRKFLKTITAPYSGVIRKMTDGYYLFQEERDIWILAGLWGTVEQVSGNQHVHIKTQTVDVNFVAFTKDSVMGELIVFPNPNELLDVEYLQNFAKNTQNKVIYIGNHLRRVVIDKAIELKINSIIGGSIDWEDFKHAAQKGLAVAVTTGFGSLETPQYIFDFFKSVSNRHVFVDGKNGLLRVPMPTATDTFKKYKMTGNSLREVTKGLSVLVYERGYFGVTGIVDDVQTDIIYVKLDKSSEIVKVRIPNIFALV